MNKNNNNAIGDLHITLRLNESSTIEDQLRSNTLRGMRGELVTHLHKEVQGMNKVRWIQSAGLRFTPIIAIDEEGNYHEFIVDIGRKARLSMGG